MGMGVPPVSYKPVVFPSVVGWGGGLWKLMNGTKSEHFTRWEANSHDSLAISKNTALWTSWGMLECLESIGTNKTHYCLGFSQLRQLPNPVAPLGEMLWDQWYFSGFGGFQKSHDFQKHFFKKIHFYRKYNEIIVFFKIFKQHFYVGRFAAGFFKQNNPASKLKMQRSLILWIFWLQISLFEITHLQYRGYKTPSLLRSKSFNSLGALIFHVFFEIKIRIGIGVFFLPNLTDFRVPKWSVFSDKTDLPERELFWRGVIWCGYFYIPGTPCTVVKIKTKL
jgi:hypothetical protein